ncbi:LysR family transcriptional regulator [Photobacterium kishitanii]|uniref:LysR family transcriptional regulator n=1 Tax=Photobacterium kishitanii TaxID=318456 RepID=UPI0007EF5AE1|nr:LysR family transcriptional regulator [Photobacterium kishitanii]OBU27335.1 LysR family transcriptional regulator [Photobacterium kishitanii]PSW67871.1 LysR family transcriptional regulator [Photobacterium kishitanii]
MTKADDLILFAQVVELGSFSRVAEKNLLTNSVVSKRIARLEQELGVQLLYRTTRKLTLSEAGKKLYKGATNVQQATTEAINTVSGLADNVTGHIKMSVPTISGDLLLADAVAEFCALHPGITVDISLENLFVDIIEDNYDLVIRTGRLEDSSLIARHIIESQWVICATPDYIKRNGQPQEPENLLEHNCLQYAYQTTGASEWEFKGEDGTYIIKIKGNFTTDNAAALRKAALGGYGIAYVPRCLVYLDLMKGELIDIMPNRVAKKLGVYAIYPFTRHPSKKIRLLIEHIRQRYLSMSEYF